MCYFSLLKLEEESFRSRDKKGVIGCNNLFSSSLSCMTSDSD